MKEREEEGSENQSKKEESEIERGQEMKAAATI